MNRGFIFDLDGTIVDSTATYREVWAQLISEAGADHDPQLFLTRPTRENLRELFGSQIDSEAMERHVARQAALGRERMRARGVRAHPGIRELIHELRHLGVRLALATSAERVNAEWTLRELRLRDCFEVIVTDQDVGRGKPAPDVYLQAVRRLGLRASQCAALEDSTTGVRAARAAGLRVIGVLTTHSERALRDAGANWIVADGSELTAMGIIKFIDNRHA